MKWIVQNNLFSEPGFRALTDALDRAGCDYDLVKVIPFSHDFEPPIEVQNPVAVMGSTTLVRIAKKHGWGPGVFWNENFTFEKWREHWGNHLLNADSKVCRFADVEFGGTVFIRPVDDLKVFSGGVVAADKFYEWKEAVVRYQDGAVNSDTLVTVASLKEIGAEYRFFVIDGKVVTGSRYKLGDRVTSSPIIDSYILDYAQARVDEWQPDRGFVLDVAVTDDGLKVVEVNNLNSAGFYHSDVSKLVQAMEAMQ